MALELNPVIIIPARLAATRLPRKPLADIHGKPMVLHVLTHALEADIGPVIVATESDEIATVVEKAGGRALLTGDHHETGTDRMYEAITLADPDRKHNIVINLQGDLPSLSGKAIRSVLDPIHADQGVDIATLVNLAKTPEEWLSPSNVKAALEFKPGDKVARALYFSRELIPAKVGDPSYPYFHHIGIYAYKRPALEAFVKLPMARLEISEKLEQLRALAAGMRIDAAFVNEAPVSVDTPDDLRAAIAQMA